MPDGLTGTSPPAAGPLAQPGLDGRGDRLRPLAQTDSPEAELVDTLRSVFALLSARPTGHSLTGKA
ncbi:MAG: hypothetical protein IPK19_24615 [Chloroflexi bacterium]|nr:hypothetical protein [Chloroflexota bacterium]